MLKNNNRKVGDRFESFVAKQFNANTVKGSGSWLWRKGDVLSVTWLIQCKYTKEKEFLLKLTDLLKAEKESYESRKDFIFCIGVGSYENVFILERVLNPKENTTLPLFIGQKTFMLNETILKNKQFYVGLIYKKDYVYLVKDLESFIDEH